MLQESASWYASSVSQRNGRGLECCASVVGVCWRSQGDWPWWIGLPFFGLLGSCRKFGQRFPPSDGKFCDFPGLRCSPREHRWSLVVRCVAGGLVPEADRCRCRPPSGVPCAVDLERWGRVRAIRQRRRRGRPTSPRASPQWSWGPSGDLHRGSGDGGRLCRSVTSTAS